MKPTCEIVVKELLSAMRGIIAEAMIAKGLTQKQVADRLEITQPAVSHYLGKVRGKNAQLLKNNKKAKAAIDEATKLLIEGKPVNMCSVCRKVKASGVLCDFCKGDECNVCQEVD